MATIFLLNGPAGSGKDTAAKYLADRFEGEVSKFAAPIKDAATAIYCGGDRDWFDEFDLDQERKNQPDPVFYGKSCRQVQIDISEDFLKKSHGPGIFGDILTTRIINGDSEFYFVSDSGFRPEAECIINAFGADEVVLIRLHRDGHTFEGDSRSYINLDDLEVNSYDVTNVTGQQEEMFRQLASIVKANYQFEEESF